MTQAKDQILESENYFLKMETNSVWWKDKFYDWK
jgi:hypothetical protein